MKCCPLPRSGKYLPTCSLQICMHPHVVRVDAIAPSRVGITMLRISNSVTSRSFTMLCTPTTRLFERVHPSKISIMSDKTQCETDVNASIAGFQHVTLTFRSFVQPRLTLLCVHRIYFNFVSWVIRITSILVRNSFHTSFLTC